MYVLYKMYQSHRKCTRDALETHWGGIGDTFDKVTFETHWEHIVDALRTHQRRLGDELVTLWVALGTLQGCIRTHWDAFRLHQKYNFRALRRLQTSRLFSLVFEMFRFYCIRIFPRVHCILDNYLTDLNSFLAVKLRC